MLNKSERSAYPTAGCSSCPFRVRATVTNCRRYWFYPLPVSCLREIRPWPVATADRKVADFYLDHGSPRYKSLSVNEGVDCRGGARGEWSFCDFYATRRFIRADTERSWPFTSFLLLHYLCLRELAIRFPNFLVSFLRWNTTNFNDFFEWRFKNTSNVKFNREIAGLCWSSRYFSTLEKFARVVEMCTKVCDRVL